MILNFCALALIVLTVLWAVGLLWSLSTEDNAQLFFPLLVVGFLFVGCLGWLAIGHSSHAIELSQEVQSQVVTTPTSVILTIEGKPVKTFTDVSDYNKYKGMTNVVVIQSGYVDIYYNTNWNDMAKSEIKN